MMTGGASAGDAARRSVNGVRILLVDDSRIVLDLLTRFLGSQDGLEIVGTAYTGRKAIEKVSSLKPDLVIIDINMPGMDGIEASRRIKESPDAPRLIVLSLHDAEPSKVAALRAGADGFCSKSSMDRDLLATIRSMFPA